MNSTQLAGRPIIVNLKIKSPLIEAFFFIFFGWRIDLYGMQRSADDELLYPHACNRTEQQMMLLKMMDPDKIVRRSLFSMRVRGVKMIIVRLSWKTEIFAQFCLDPSLSLIHI